MVNDRSGRSRLGRSDRRSTWDIQITSIRTTHDRRDVGLAGRGAIWATDTNTSPNTHEVEAEAATDWAADIAPAVAPQSKQHSCCSTNVQCTATSSSVR